MNNFSTLRLTRINFIVSPSHYIILNHSIYQSIIRIPWLRHDNSWKAFLKPTSSTVTDSESNNTGYMQARACLEQMELPSESTMGARVEGVREEVLIMEKHGIPLFSSPRPISDFFCLSTLQLLQLNYCWIEQ